MKTSLITFAFVIFTLGCGTPATNTRPANTISSPTPVPTAAVPKNGDYQGKGKVLKINIAAGSVELDHDEMKDAMMPAMQMEFNVSDKAILKGLNVGDEANFTLRYNNGQETIVAISKAK